MRYLIAIAAVCAVLGPAGCKREETPTEPTVSDVQAKIDKVKADDKMPPNIKQMVLGQLENQKRKAESKSRGG